MGKDVKKKFFADVVFLQHYFHRIHASLFD